MSIGNSVFQASKKKLITYLIKSSSLLYIQTIYSMTNLEIEETCVKREMKKKEVKIS